MRNAPSTTAIVKSLACGVILACLLVLGLAAEASATQRYEAQLLKEDIERFYILDDRSNVADGQLFFAASDGEHGMELWSSDGTRSGTGMVKDIRTGVEGGVANRCSQNFAASCLLGSSGDRPASMRRLRA